MHAAIPALIKLDPPQEGNLVQSILVCFMCKHRNPIQNCSHWNSFWRRQTEQAAQNHFIHACSQGTSVQSHAATERLYALFQFSQFTQRKIQFRHVPRISPTHLPSVTARRDCRSPARQRNLLRTPHILINLAAREAVPMRI